MLIEENKWRAVRYGINGKMIDFGKSTEVPFRTLITELVDFVDDAAQIFGTREQVRGVLRILDEGTSADRQLDVYKRSGNDPKAVVDWLIRETMTGIDDPPPSGIPGTISPG
jgi:glutamate---cysteine ligase / carboxylate-amine ligase